MWPTERSPAADHQQTVAIALDSGRNRLLVGKSEVACRIVVQHDQRVFAQPLLRFAPGQRLARRELGQPEAGALGALHVAALGSLAQEEQLRCVSRCLSECDQSGTSAVGCNWRARILRTASASEAAPSNTEKTV